MVTTPYLLPFPTKTSPRNPNPKSVAAASLSHKPHSPNTASESDDADAGADAAPAGGDDRWFAFDWLRSYGTSISLPLALVQFL